VGRARVKGQPRDRPAVRLQRADGRQARGAGRQQLDAAAGLRRRQQLPVGAEGEAHAVARGAAVRGQLVPRDQAQGGRGRPGRARARVAAGAAAVGLFGGGVREANVHGRDVQCAQQARPVRLAAAPHVSACSMPCKVTENRWQAPEKPWTLPLQKGNQSFALQEQPGPGPGAPDRARCKA